VTGSAMSIRVQLTMLSGRSEEVEVTLDGTVNDLRRLAQAREVGLKIR